MLPFELKTAIGLRKMWDLLVQRW